MSNPVVTRSYSNYRDGCQTGETRLTSEYVQKNGIRVLGKLQLDDPRGTEGQVLAVPGLTMRDGMTHDVAFVCDMSNSVYAFDINTFKLLWKQHLGNPIVVTKQWDMWGINPNWGILSTPAIDLANRTMHAVSLSSTDGTMQHGTYRFHTLNLLDGSDKYSPLSLNGVSFKPTDGSAAKVLGSVPRKQRPGLLLDTRNGRTTVFVAFGSFLESANSNCGFVLAIDVTSAPVVTASWITGWKHPPNSGIWMAGGGLSQDDDGYLYGMTGNGGFSPPTDFGECIFKLKYTPPSGSTAGKLECVDWWSPYSDAGRAGQDPTWPNVGSGKANMAGMDMTGMENDEPLPTNAMNQMAMSSNVRSVYDQDLGSGGPLLIPKSFSGYDKDIIIGAGKDGIAWVLDAGNMGQTQNVDFAPDKIGRNYAKLLTPPYGLTFNGMPFDLAPSDLTKLPVLPYGKTVHVHGAPVCYRSPDHGLMMFVGGENAPVRAFRVGKDGSLTYLACSQEVASAGMPNPGGMPGCMTSLSCTQQGDNTGILWGLMPLNGDSNRHVVQGRLVAWGSNWIDNDGHLITLWDSAQWNVVFSHCKFNIATLSNNHVLVPTYDGNVLVFG